MPVVQPKDLKIGQALVKVEYTGVCHTDLHVMLGDWPLCVVQSVPVRCRSHLIALYFQRRENKCPLIGGHEGAGRIVALAEGSDSSLKIGDRVGIKVL